MDFGQLVQYIKDDGCRVVLYKNKECFADKSSGLFHCNDNGPIITLAMKGWKKGNKSRKIELLLHEYGHYMQWKCGFLELCDSLCDAHTIFDRWVSGKDYKQEQINLAKKVKLWVEWDAEMRAYRFAIKNNIKNFYPVSYLKGANAYMSCIKWGFENRKNFYQAPARYLFKPEILTPEKLFAPLTKKEKMVLKNIKLEP